jgi:hypothetical protein
MTQNDQIEMALRNGEAITPLDALRRFGSLRLGARIYDLRAKGVPIEKRIIAVDTANGEGAHVAEYRLARGA